MDRGLCVLLDEAIGDNCSDLLKYTRVADVREPANPVTIATFPTPDEADYCQKGGRFGPHNPHEKLRSLQSDELTFVAYQNAGVRVFDIRGSMRPEKVAHHVAEPPEHMVNPGRAAPR